MAPGNGDMKCLICDRIKSISVGTNTYFVRELKTGYVVIEDHQLFKGYALFLSKIHAKELHELEPSFRQDFLLEMSQVAKAVFDAFQPGKLNYELLGNSHEHLHWHIIPRYKNDAAAGKPIWVLNSNIRRAHVPDGIEYIKSCLARALKKEVPRAGDESGGDSSEIIAVGKV